ncbi:transcription factor bHLH68 isoform X4 [Argentina anserina]|uniref:transcription factor bHLH68 isoform X4 n=1 Tax=Argentina anserina TaxID=57926 RepID=UPI0021766ED4|nr:transcription factor bHLH68 isoform X4 [Potentilla anserina]
MNRGHVLQSSPVQQMMAAGNPNWWNINSMRAPITTNQPSSSPFLPPPHHPSFFIPQFQPTNSSSLPFIPSWHDNNNQNQNQELPEPWSQLLLGGLVGEDDKANGLRQLIHQAKKLEGWEEQILISQAHPNDPANVDVKQENSPPGSFVYGHHGTGNNNEDFQSAALCSLSQIMPTTTAASASSPNSSCVTSFGSNMLDFSNKSEGRHPPQSRSSSECNSSATGGAVKKARVQPSSSAQPTFKVRKEKLGDRITALHQLVSPFGKTDTASVLLEAIGYIRFLQNQIEALSLPYLGSGSPNMRRQQQQSAVHGERSCMFPEDPGQDAYEEPKKDLRSRGLCLVPVSCTLQVGSDNGADYWAPAALGGGFQ